MPIASDPAAAPVSGRAWASRPACAPSRLALGGGLRLRGRLRPSASRPRVRGLGFGRRPCGLAAARSSRSRPWRAPACCAPRRARAWRPLGRRSHRLHAFERPEPALDRAQSRADPLEVVRARRAQLLERLADALRRRGELVGEVDRAVAPDLRAGDLERALDRRPDLIGARSGGAAAWPACRSWPWAQTILARPCRAAPTRPADRAARAARAAARRSRARAAARAGAHRRAADVQPRTAGCGATRARRRTARRSRS